MPCIVSSLLKVQLLKIERKKFTDENLQLLSNITLSKIEPVKLQWSKVDSLNFTLFNLDLLKLKP